jgi:hypothetical protein
VAYRPVELESRQQDFEQHCYSSGDPPTWLSRFNAGLNLVQDLLCCKVGAQHSRVYFLFIVNIKPGNGSFKLAKTRKYISWIGQDL